MNKKTGLWKSVLFSAAFLLFTMSMAVVFADAAEKKGDQVGIIKLLSILVDGSGTSYLNYVSPASDKEFRVSVHKTADDLVAYCLDRTKDSDMEDYNWNYEELKDYSRKETNLQRNILLCGYPGNSVKKLEEMYGYETNVRCATQATQMAIWICNYMYDKNVSMNVAWKEHRASNTGEYKAVELSKAILERAYDMLNQSLKLSYEKVSETEELLTYDLVIKTKGQYFPLKGKLTGLPEGSQIQTDSCIKYEKDGSILMDLVEGEGRISVTFSRYIDVSKIHLTLKGTMPIPPSYAGILYYRNTDSDYQSMVVVKEVEPGYEEQELNFSKKPDPQMTICIKKEDSSGKENQGDAMLAGAKYTIYDENGKAREVLTIGEDHKAVSGLLPVGVYTVKETESPEGYLLDETVYSVDGKKGNAALEIMPFEVISKEQVITGKIRIVKDLENPDSDSEEKVPAKGVTFMYYLNSNPQEKMQIVLDEEGIGESGWIPYGTYTLEETDAPAGWETVAPKTVKVEGDKKVLTYYITDPLDASECKIIKKDKETGKQIAFAGTRFQIRRKSTGELVTMSLTKHGGLKVEEFVTNKEGYLVLPEKLQAGEYLLYELEAPKGYVKAQNPAAFTIPYHYDGTIEVVMENEPVTCALTVEKTGPVLWSSKIEMWEDYSVTIPVFKDSPLEGVVYELTATADIKTLDGTIRMKKGEKRTASTGAAGKAFFKGLFPGNYELQEIKTQDGYILNGTKKNIQLTAGDGSLAVVEENMQMTNKLQQMTLLIKKEMEQAKSNLSDVYDYVVFGLYTKEPIHNKDGQVVAREDTLLDIYKMDSDGNGVSQMNTALPYGTYYMKELETHPDYLLDEKIYEFTFQYKEDGGDIQQIILTEEPIVNKKIPVEIEDSVDPEKPEKTIEKPAKSPKTGDYSQIMLWCFCAMMSLVTVGIYKILLGRKCDEIR